MICKKCGAQLPDNADYCISCGTNVKNEKNSHRKSFLVGMAVIIVGIIVCLTFYLKFSKESLNSDSLQLLNNKHATITKEDLIDYIKIYEQHVSLIKSGKEYIEVDESKNALDIINDKFSCYLSDSETLINNKDLSTMYLNFYQLNALTAQYTLDSSVISDDENGNVQIGTPEQLSDYCDEIENSIDTIKEKYYN